MFPVIERTPNHEEQASDLPITTDQVQVIEYDITSVSYLEHTKKDADESAPKTMRVMYYDGLVCVASEWVCIEHSGRAGESAYQWWTARTDHQRPAWAADAARLANLGYLAEPTKIWVSKMPGQKFPRITKYLLGPRVVSDEVEVMTDEWGEEVRASKFATQEELDDLPF
jgi:DNA repair protein RadD